MKITPFSNEPDNIEFIVLDGRMKGKVVWEFESDLAVNLHIKEILLEKKNKMSDKPNLPPNDPYFIWDNDEIQFARLLAELNACGLTKEQLDFLSESADLTTEMVVDILDRAEMKYEDDKRNIFNP